MKKPNTGDVLATDAMHAIEHIGATWLRSSRFKDQIIYFGPMGCRTGFYLITRDLTGQPLVDLVIDAFRFIAAYEGEIPGAQRQGVRQLPGSEPGGRQAAGRRVPHRH